MTDAKTDLTRRRFLQRSGMAAAGGLLIAACGNGDEAGTTTTTAAGTTTTAGATTTTAGATTTTGGGMTPPQSDLEVVNFDFNTPNRNLQAPYWMAIAKGYFEEVGIDLRPENITGLDEYLPSVFAGDIDIALMDATILFPAEDQAVLDGNPNGLTWVACVLGGQPVIMIGAEGVTADNLEGKTIGCARAGSMNEVLAKYAIGELGYDWETDVNCVAMTGGSNDWVTAMISGQIDATIAFPRHIALAEEIGGGAIYNQPRLFPQAGLGVLRSTLEEYPNFAPAWIHAYIKGQQFVKDPANWEEVRETIAGEFGLDYPDNTFAVMNIANEQLLTQDLGWDPATMDELMEFARPLGGWRENLPWRDYTDLQYLHVAQDALGLSQNPTDLNNGVTLLG